MNRQNFGKLRELQSEAVSREEISSVENEELSKIHNEIDALLLLEEHSIEQLDRISFLFKRSGNLLLKIDPIKSNRRREVGGVKQRIETDRAFRRAAYLKYWFRYFGFILSTIVLLFITMSPYAYFSNHYNHVLLIALPPLAFVLSIFVAFKIVNPKKCMACGNTDVIHTPPIYCRNCGMTYLFRRLGKWIYNKRA